MTTKKLVYLVATKCKVSAVESEIAVAAAKDHLALAAEKGYSVDVVGHVYKCCHVTKAQAKEIVKVVKTNLK